MNIEYLSNIDGIESSMLSGFFDGWPNPPSPEMHLKILQRSSKIVLAVDRESDNVVGFINAISDNTLSAYLPLLEVLPEYRNRGIGGELVKRIMAKLSDFYMIDLVCDEALVPYYEKLGLKPTRAMSFRNYSRQNGNPDP